jgi:hypothetical protein
MMTRQKIKRDSIAIVCFFALLGMVVSAAQGYSREKALYYATRYSNNDNAHPVRNLTIYYDFSGPQGGDCAYFVSQCLIAGGMRFRASKRSDDNIVPAEDCPDELDLREFPRTR